MSKKKSLSLLCGLLVLAMLISLGGRTLPGEAYAESSSELKQQLDKLEGEKDEIDSTLAALRKEQSENQSELGKMVHKKNVIDQEIALLHQQEENINNQISTYSLLIADKQEELDKAQAELQELQIKNKARIRAMEEGGELSYWAVLFEASSFTEMLDRLEMIQEIAKADRLCLAEMDKAAKEVAQAKSEMETEQAALQEKRTELEGVKVELDAKRVEVDEVLIELKAKSDEYAAEIERSEQLQEDLAAQLAAKQDAYEDAKYLEWLATSVATPPQGPSNEVGGKTWLVPCSYSAITSPFGYRWHPLSGIWKMHNGVDMAGASGTPIRATRSGYVTVAAFQPGGAGNYVALSHGDGYGSIYMHMTHYIVYAGQYVDAGQVIGYMGTTGGSTGVHLHFGISYNGVYVNPANYIAIG